MSDTIQRRLEEVMALLPCPMAGCWGLHGAETSYYYDTDSECREPFAGSNLEIRESHLGGSVATAISAISQV
jgi:hypothetical protein